MHNLTIKLQSIDQTVSCTRYELAATLRQLINSYMPLVYQAQYGDLFTDHLGNVYLNNQKDLVIHLNMHVASMVDTYNILMIGYMRKI